MFDGVADQFHHLIASRAAAPPSSASSSSLPPNHLPLTFTHLASTPPTSTTNEIVTTIFPRFDLYPPPPPSQQHPHAHHLNIQQPISEFLPHPLRNHHQLHHSTTPRTLQKDEEKTGEDDDELACMKLLPPPDGEDCPWTDEEVLALVRIRSSTENWFPEVTWEHVSWKLQELGFKRSAEKCKEKFEEGSRFFSGTDDDEDDNGYGKSNYRILSELEEICQGDRRRKPCDPNIEGNGNEMKDRPEEKEGETARIRDSKENRECGNEDAVQVKERTKRKRRRQKFEMFKRFCEEVVEKLIVQQEEVNNKLLEDLVKRDEEMVAREEEWKKQEMDRINKELDTRANDQAIAGDRQATVIELLKKFTSSMLDHKIQCPIGESGEGQSFPSVPTINCSVSTSSRPPPTEFGDLDSKSKDAKNAAISYTRIPQAAEDSPSVRKYQNPNFPEPPATAEVKDQEVASKRWPRDEVQALINLRSGIDNREKADHSRHSGSHGEEPLWERISRGMTELGYKRSAKRCKEKWENINKYFRKTRDVRKKRSADSKTCPYFQQLSSLYGQGRVVPPSPSPSPGGVRR